MPAPGAREFVTRQKQKMRKRYLNDTIENLYKKYTNESGNVISRALFYRLRPFYVVNKKFSARDTSLCKEHTNFQMIINN